MSILSLFVPPSPLFLEVAVLFLAIAALLLLWALACRPLQLGCMGCVAASGPAGRRNQVVTYKSAGQVEDLICLVALSENIVRRV